MNEGWGGDTFGDDYSEELGLSANRSVFDPIEERFGREPTLDEIQRANDAVMFNLNDDGTDRWGTAQGYACALTAIMAAASCDTHPKGGDAQQAPSPMSGAVPNDSEADAQPSSSPRSL